MTKEKALEIVGDRAHWELVNIKKALTFMGALNTPEEDERLEAVKVLLKNK
jgi:hypothetical protein